MAWIEVHQSLPTHRKTKKFARELGLKAQAGTAQAIGHLTMLWLWSVDNAIDGDLSGVDPQDIADAAGWIKAPRILIGALFDSGFLDEGMVIHDWDDYAGKLATSMESKKTGNRERQRRFREKNQQPGDCVTSHDAVTDRNGEDNALVTRDSNALVTRDVTRDSNALVTRDSNALVTRDVTRDSNAASHVTVTRRNGATVPNLTVPNLTVPNRIDDDDDDEDAFSRAYARARGFDPGLRIRVR